MKSSADNVRESFKEGIEGRCLVVHFDGKIVKEFTDGRKQSNKRCAVLVSSPNLDSPQLLGVPVVVSASGQNQASDTKPSIFTIKLMKSSLVSMQQT